MSASGTTSPSPSRKSLSQIIRDHHHSVNAAYNTYYSAGANTTSSSRSASVSPTPAPRRSSIQSEDKTMSESTIKKAWQAAIKRAKEHHDSVNAAVETYYGNSIVGSCATSAASTPRTSIEAPVTEERAVQQKRESGASKLWSAAVKRAKEHHRSVNAAAGMYYGAGLRV